MSTTEEQLNLFIRRYWDCWPICMMPGCQLPAVISRGKFYLDPYCFRCSDGMPGEWRWLEADEIRERW